MRYTGQNREKNVTEQGVANEKSWREEINI
jgi:hypothetical protein